MEYLFKNKSEPYTTIKHLCTEDILNPEETPCLNNIQKTAGLNRMGQTAEPMNC